MCRPDELSPGGDAFILKVTPVFLKSRRQLCSPKVDRPGNCIYFGAVVLLK